MRATPRDTGGGCAFFRGIYFENEGQKGIMGKNVTIVSVSEAGSSLYLHDQKQTTYESRTNLYRMFGTGGLLYCI